MVTLYYQTTTKEYMEFLRDTNVTNNAGQHIYDRWVEFGKSAPVDMDTATLALTAGVLGDLNGDGVVDGTDLGLLLGGWGSPGASDLSGDGTTDGTDLGLLLGNWG